MRKLIMIVTLVWGISTVQAQMPAWAPYFPQSGLPLNWKYNLEAFYSDDANSNNFTNDFFGAINRSEYLTDELRDQQIANLDGQTLTGRYRQSGLNAWFNSNRKPGKMFFYAGVDFQQVLDSRLDPDLVSLLLKGNKPFAGQTLSVNNSEYLNLYFNRIKGGAGFQFGTGDVQHDFSAILAFTAGQNYDRVKLTSSSFYTHPDGDYLDVVIRAENKAADTVWGKVYDLNGIGISTDLHYAIRKEKSFYAGVTIQNLGFINWNRNPFNAAMDSTFRFDGVANDTTSNQQIPSDYSYDNLRDLIFNKPGDKPFSQALPVILNATAGKFFSDGQFYAGINGYVYPTLISNYKVELFGTWNLKNRLQITPILTHSSYSKLNFGLAAGWQVNDHFILRAGSSYLNTLFSQSAAVGKGGYVRVLVIF